MRNFPEPSSYWSEDEGRLVVEAWQRSGENAAAFARGHGLRANRLAYWIKRLEAHPTTATLSFVPAAVVASDEVAAIIRTPDGITIELASATSAQIVAIASGLVRSSP